MIAFHERTELVQMLPEALREHIQDICLEKKEQQQRVNTIKSPLGVEQVARWEAKLADTLNRYSRIRVANMPDRDIVLAFIETRNRETFIREELDALRGAEKVYEKLDAYHALCQDVLKKREEAQRRAR